MHSLSHSLGGVDPRLHHGTLNAVFLPAVIRFNAGHESLQQRDTIARMAQAMGLPAGADVAQAVHELTGRLGLPTGLAQMGVQASQFDAVIAHALKDHCHQTNPRMASPEDYRAMLEASMQGAAAFGRDPKKGRISDPAFFVAAAAPLSGRRSAPGSRGPPRPRHRGSPRCSPRCSGFPTTAGCGPGDRSANPSCRCCSGRPGSHR